MKKILTILKLKWAQYILEIMVIMIGILGAFMLDRWNENQVNKKLEQQYLQNLLSDIELDIRNLKNMSQVAQRANEAKIFILGFIDGDQHPPDSILANMGDLEPMTRFIPTRVTIDELKNSDGFQVIRNINLRRQIAILYHHYDLVEKIEEDVNHARLRIQNIRIDNFVVASQSYYRRGLVEDTNKLFNQIRTNDQFKNALISNLSNTRDSVFRETLTKVEDFKQMLRQNIK